MFLVSVSLILGEKLTACIETNSFAYIEFSISSVAKWCRDHSIADALIGLQIIRICNLSREVQILHTNSRYGSRA